jgi:hypothetical protein
MFGMKSMTKSHKWAEVIKAWADGKNIQFKHKKDVDWYDICTDEGADSPNFNIPTLEWRIKPTIKLNVCYRIALWRKYNSTNYHLELVTFTGNCSEASVKWNTISKNYIDTFVRWIGDPIHIEIEE